MNRAADHRSPDQIERDVHYTQDRIAGTFDELMDRLHPMDLVRSLFSSSSGTSSQAWDQARRNPLALGMIAAGTAWLFSSHDARPKSFTHGNSHGNGADKQSAFEHGAFEPGVGYHDPHTAYVSHMAAVEQRENEPHTDYQRRRDTARGTYLMLERGHEEDDASYRSRLDKATEDLRSRSSAFGDRVKEMAHDAKSRLSSAGSSVSSGGRSAAAGTQDFFFGNPLVTGLLAAAAGAAAGATAPMSETEHETLGDAGDAARRAAGQKASEAAHKANELADKANEKIAPDGSGGRKGNQQKEVRSQTAPPQTTYL